jgi:hypothetical protein
MSPLRKRPHAPHGPYYTVAWRDEWGETGQGRLLGFDRADEFARQFDSSRSWAVIIGPLSFTFIREYGVRFNAIGKIPRKPPGRAAVSDVQDRKTFEPKEVSR